jgi:hypothetical protein
MGTITGTIFWDPDALNNAPAGGPPTILDRLQQITPLDTSKVNASLVITANQSIPPVGFGFGSTKVVGNPGQVTSANMHENLVKVGPAFNVIKSCSASYEIGGLPLNEQLFVEISAKTPPFIGGNVGVSPSPLGTAFVTLTSQSQPGPNFSLAKLSIF